jgi:hypothetical protein
VFDSRVVLEALAKVKAAVSSPFVGLVFTFKFAVVAVSQHSPETKVWQVPLTFLARVAPFASALFPPQLHLYISKMLIIHALNSKPMNVTIPLPKLFSIKHLVPVFN